MNTIVILNGIGYLVPTDKTKNANLMNDAEYDNYKEFIKTFPIDGVEKTITDREFASLENKNWHR